METNHLRNIWIIILIILFSVGFEFWDFLNSNPFLLIWLLWLGVGCSMVAGLNLSLKVGYRGLQITAFLIFASTLFSTQEYLCKFSGATAILLGIIWIVILDGTIFSPKSKS